jgi:hypothetical protein
VCQCVCVCVSVSVCVCVCACVCECVRGMQRQANTVAQVHATSEYMCGTGAREVGQLIRPIILTVRLAAWMHDHDPLVYLSQR